MESVLIVLMLIAALSTACAIASIALVQRRHGTEVAADRVSLREVGWMLLAGIGCYVAAVVVHDRTGSYDEAVFAGLAFGIAGAGLVYLGRTVLPRYGAFFEWGALLFTATAAALIGWWACPGDPTRVRIETLVRYPRPLHPARQRRARPSGRRPRRRRGPRA